MLRKIRMGMVGGGQGAFIGAVHRMAAGLDGAIELVCGAFSSNPERSRASGRELLLDDRRVYGAYSEMFEAERGLPENERMDFVAIVTPNDLHFGPAKLALEAGFAFGVFRQVLRKDFDGNHPVEPGVLGLVDFAHSPLANRREDLVRA